MRTERLLWALVVVLVLPVAGRAAENQKDLEDKISRLEALLQRQEAKLNELESQLQIADEESVRQHQIQQTKELIREAMADTDFQSKLVSTTLQAGYDKGFYIRSSDQDFELKIQLYTQFRYVGLNRQTDNPNRFGRQRRDDLSGFEWERTRLIFKGHLFSKKLAYYLQLDGDTDGANAVQVLDLYMTYEYAPGQKIWWGQGKTPQGYERLSSSSVQSFVDRSFVSGAFDLGRTIGIAAKGQIALAEKSKFTYVAGVFNGVNDQNDDVRDVDTNPAYAARVAVECGDYGQGRSDLRKNKGTLAGLFGGHFAYVNDNNDTNGAALLLPIPEFFRFGRGGYGLVDATGTDYYQFGADIGAKYQGFSVAAEWWLRHINNDFRRSPWILSSLDDSFTYQGGVVQVGYLIPNTKIEPVARAGGIWGMRGDNVWEYAVGANYYIHGQALKLSADVSFTPEAATVSSSRNVGLNDDVVLYRVQIQAATK